MDKPRREGAVSCILGSPNFFDNPNTFVSPQDSGDHDAHHTPHMEYTQLSNKEGKDNDE